MTNESFARVKIDQLLKDIDWRLTDGISVRFEYPLNDGGKADYALFDRQGRALAVLEAKSTSVSLSTGEAQGHRYADQLGVPFIFLSNGEEVWFCDKGQDAHFRRVETVFSQDDLVRRKAAREIRCDPLDIPIDSRIAGAGGRNFQTACIDSICQAATSGKNIEAGNGTSGYRILKVSAVTSGIFKPYEAKPAPDDYVPAEAHQVRDRDFLFSRANTSELVGAVAIAHEPPDGLLLPDKIWRIDWDPERIEPQYAYSLLRSSEVRRIFALIGSGTSDSMKNISQGKLVRVAVPLPPLTLQTVFAEQVQRLEALARYLDAAAVKAEAMVAGLSAEVFKTKNNRTGTQRK